jgi:hypothetical protein
LRRLHDRIPGKSKGRKFHAAIWPHQAVSLARPGRDRAV